MADKVRIRCILVFLALQTLVFCSTALAQVSVNKTAGPGWIRGKADPVSPEAAGIYYAQREAEQVSKTGPSAKSPTQVLQSASTQSIPQGAATEQTDEIIELARGLLHDPKLIYDHVHNHIDYVPYFGSKKGATLTMLDGSGNDFDQASLMIALLRASGYTAQYQYGTMDFASYETSPLANWVGSSNNYHNILSSGGIPFIWAGTHYDVTRVWVKAVIDGTDYQFDPAFKTYKSGEKIDINAALGYNRSELLAAAGGTVTSDYVQNLNEPALNAKLTQYAMNYVNFIRTNHPNDGIEDVLGRRSIVKTESTALPTSLPFPATATATWDEVPDEYTTTLRVQHAGIDRTFLTPEIGGKRLTITYAGADNHPELRLDGNLVASGSPTSAGAQYSMVLLLNEPYAAPDGAGTYGDQTETYNNKSGATYAIISGFGDTTDDLLNKRQRALDEAKDAGLADTSERVLGENLNVAGLTWLKEVGMADKLISDIADGVSITHHRVGRMAQEGSYFIDVAQCLLTTLPRVDGDPKGEWPAFRASMLFSSALEYGVLEQLMGADKPAVSTVKVLRMANAAGDKVFYATNSNYASIRSQLVSYPADVLNGFASQLSSGDATFLVLPQNGNYVLNSWQGKGYIRGTPTGLDMMVDLELHGGAYCALGLLTGTTTLPEVAAGLGLWLAFQKEINSTESYIQEWRAKDPVDTATGSFVYDSTDLSLGAFPPKGLAFTRHYSSQSNLVKTSLGNGWRHNFDVRVAVGNWADPIFGGRRPIESAPAIATICMSVDLLTDGSQPVDWEVSALASKWAGDSCLSNLVSARTGKAATQYIRLADGTYSSAPGATSRLVRNSDGTFSVIARFGESIDYAQDGRATSWTDSDGNTLSFSYVDGNLARVEDCYGRYLTFEYADAKIIRVNDSSGRTVSYEYDALDNLDGYIDPAGHNWSYGYSDKHQITSITNPLPTVIISNSYNALGRLVSQSTPRQDGISAEYHFYFSRYRNVMEEPGGAKSVYLYDRQGLPKGFRCPSGALIWHREYDGSGHMVKSKDASGNLTQLEYDNLDNLTRVTNARGESLQFQYDSESRLVRIVDPEGRSTTFEYNSAHHLVSGTDGAGNRMTRAYSSNGLLESMTDARSITSTFGYDRYGQVNVARVAGRNDRLFEYDQIGHLVRLTDQVGAETRLEYDTRGLNTRRVDPSGAVTTLRYDAAGQLVEVIDRNAQSVSYEYSPSGRLQTVALPNGYQVRCIYDLQDRLIQVLDPTGTTSYTQSADGLMQSSENAFGLAVSYEHDVRGNLVAITYPGSKTIHYSYDDTNRIVSVSTWTGHTATYAYDTAGRLIETSGLNGTVTKFSYDVAGRLVGLDHRTSNGMLLARCVQTLDGNGNVTSIVNDEATTAPLNKNVSYVYNLQRNRLLTAGVTAYSWDLEGQLTTAGGSQFSFDALHHLTSVQGTHNSLYQYNGLGLRLSATRDGIITRYLYDTSGNLLAEADAANNITAYYVYGGNGLLARIDSTGAVLSYHFNTAGNTVALTDSNQSVVNRYSYDPFGCITEQVEAFPQPFKFVGKHGVMAEPDNLYYMRARYYDSVTGRFISEDPINFRGGLNLFEYAGSNPTSQIDPFGLKSGPTSLSGFPVDPNMKVTNSAGADLIGSGLSCLNYMFFQNNWCGGGIGGGETGLPPGKAGDPNVKPTNWFDYWCMIHDLETWEAQHRTGISQEQRDDLIGEANARVFARVAAELVIRSLVFGAFAAFPDAQLPYDPREYGPFVGNW